MITLNDWRRWLDQAKPGSQITYATAVTLGDQHLTPKTLAVAEQAKIAFAAGKVD